MRGQGLTEAEVATNSSEVERRNSKHEAFQRAILNAAERGVGQWKYVMSKLKLTSKHQLDSWEAVASIALRHILLQIEGSPQAIQSWVR